VGCPVTFLLIRRALDLLRLGPSPDEKDVEIAVLRHQLAVLHRQCIIRAKTNSGSGPIRTPFRFIPNKLPAESERGQ
jgi:hypothetical protein